MTATVVYKPTPEQDLTILYGNDTRGQLTSVNTPDGTAYGTTISFTHDADGNRLSKTVTTSGPVPTSPVIKDVYEARHIAYQTDGART